MGSSSRTAITYGFIPAGRPEVAAIGDDRGVRDRPLIGRDAPLRELEDALAAPPAAVLLSGEAGIGKTRLVTEIESAAGFVLHGECVEFGGEELRLRAGRRGAARPPGRLARGASSTGSGRGTRCAGGACCRARRPAAAARGALLGAAARPARPARRRAGAGACWCSRTSTGPTRSTLRPARVPRPQPARGAARRAGHLPRRRRAPGGGAAARERARAGAAPVRRIELDAARRATTWPASSRRSRGRPRAGDAGRASCTPARAGTRSSSRSCYAARTDDRSPRPCCVRIERLDERRCSPPLAAAGGPRLARAAGAARRSTPDALRAALDAGRARARARRAGVPARPDRRGRLRAAAARRARGAAPRASRPRTSTIRRPARAPLRAGGPARRGARGVDRGRGRRAAAVFAYAEAGRALRARAGAGGAPPTASICSPARPRRRASAATPERAVKRCRGALERETDQPPHAPGCSNGSASTSSGTTRPRSRATRRRCGLAPGEPRLLAAKGHALMGLRRFQEARACCEAALDAGAAPRITLAVVLTVPRRRGGGRGARAAAPWSWGRLGGGDRSRVPAPRRGPARARRPRGARWRRWWTANGRPRGSACAAPSGTSCTSTAPTTCCGSGAGTRPSRGSRTPRGWTSRARRTRCGGRSRVSCTRRRVTWRAARAALEAPTTPACPPSS